MSKEYFIGTGDHSTHLHVTNFNERVQLLIQVNGRSEEVKLTIEKTKELIDALNAAISEASEYLPNA